MFGGQGGGAGAGYSGVGSECGDGYALGYAAAGGRYAHFPHQNVWHHHAAAAVATAAHHDQYRKYNLSSRSSTDSVNIANATNL